MQGETYEYFFKIHQGMVICIAICLIRRLLTGKGFRAVRDVSAVRLNACFGEGALSCFFN